LRLLLSQAALHTFHEEPMAKLGWLTDIHLDWLSPAQRRAFYQSLRGAGLDALLIGGDIGEATTVERYLAELETAFAGPIYFVLGNHDFYKGSLERVRERVARQVGNSQRLVWLSMAGVVPLSKDTALVGHDGWADGRLGDGPRSEVLLNDHFLIEELSWLERPELYRRLAVLGDEAAECLGAVFEKALESFPRVVVLTHVPPFAEACWHEGRISNPDYLPHFASQALGRAIVEALERHPGREVTVLCGHTHSAGEATIRPGLTVFTGGARYGHPELQRVLHSEYG
jgi:predicted phosphohydrolase